MPLTAEQVMRIRSMNSQANRIKLKYATPDTPDEVFLKMMMVAVGMELAAVKYARECLGFTDVLDLVA